MQRFFHDQVSGVSWTHFAGLQFAVAVAEPRYLGGSFEDQADEALASLEILLREAGVHESPVHLAAFLARADLVPLARAKLKNHFGNQLPAVTYIPQPPLSGAQLVLEACSVGSPAIERLGENLVRVGHGGRSWVLCSQADPRAYTTGVFNETISALSALRVQLARAGAGFEHVLRTWYYLGDITEVEDDCERYRELNRARAAFYEGVQFLNECVPAGQVPGSVYPASTGIGTEGRGIRVAGLALLDAGPDLVATPIENPHQTSAFQYAARYSPRSPQFTRAMALTSGVSGVILVSGTAGITGSESRHPGDAVAQTHLTLDNIEALLAEENLHRHGLSGPGARLSDMIQLRVYVKRPADLAAIRTVCEQRMGRVSAIYVRADVCRPELLVEIEGIALRSR